MHCRLGAQIQQLLERKKLQLLGLQRGLRSQVAAEQRLQQDADVSRLAEWSAWRRPMPDQPQLPLPPLVPPLRWAADAHPSAHQLQAEMQRCAPVTCCWDTPRHSRFTSAA